MDKIRGPNSKLVTDGREAQNENKHSSPDKIGRLQSLNENQEKNDEKNCINTNHFSPVRNRSSV